MEFKFDSSAFLPEEPVEEVAEVLAEEPIVEDVKEEVEPIVEDKPKHKKDKGGKVVYATKLVVTEGVTIPAGYSKVYGEDKIEKIIKHPKVRLASEKEIATYFKGDE